MKDTTTMSDKTGTEKTLWDAINAARSATQLGRLNHAELEEVLAFLASQGWTLTKVERAKR
jgi:hypothetical protein